MCHTNLGAASGGLPFPLPGVLGHEGAGVVEAVGSAVTGIAPDDHVVLSFTSGARCRKWCGGHPAYRPSPLDLVGGRRADGSSTITSDGIALGGHLFGHSGFARLALIDEQSLVKVDPDVPLEPIAPMGCGVETGVGLLWNTLPAQVALSGWACSPFSPPPSSNAWPSWEKGQGALISKRTTRVLAAAASSSSRVAGRSGRSPR